MKNSWKISFCCVSIIVFLTILFGPYLKWHGAKYCFQLLQKKFKFYFDTNISSLRTKFIFPTFEMKETNILALIGLISSIYFNDRMYSNINILYSSIQSKICSWHLHFIYVYRYKVYYGRPYIWLRYIMWSRQYYNSDKSTCFYPHITSRRWGCPCDTFQIQIYNCKWLQ